MARVLITNDDGYRARGIRVLAPAIAALGHEVLVVAPRDDQSGVGSARAGTVNRPIATVSEDAGGITYTGIDGTPALAVTLATLGAFGPVPDLVVSGINHGYNLGVPVFHSGTVAAALTAGYQRIAALTTGYQRIAALAVSIGAQDPEHLETAGAVAAETLGWLAGEPAGTVVSLNVPDRPLDQLAGARHASLASIARSRLAATTTPDGQLMIVLEPVDASAAPGTDEAALADGYVSVTPLSGVTGLPDDRAATYLAKRLAG